MPKDILDELKMTIDPAEQSGEKDAYQPVEDYMLDSQDDAKSQNVEGKEIKIDFEAGARKQISALGWTIDTKYINRLYYNGRPFRARCLRFYVRNIHWQAAPGWPVHESYCPFLNYRADMVFRRAKMHQIVPIFGGYYWTGCSASASGCGYGTSQVYFCVNDGRNWYAKHTGTFQLIVTAWA